MSEALMNKEKKINLQQTHKRKEAVRFKRTILKLIIIINAPIE